MEAYSIRLFVTGFFHWMSSSFFQVLPCVRISFPRQEKEVLCLFFCSNSLVFKQTKKQSNGIFLQLFSFPNKILPGDLVSKVQKAEVLWLNKGENRGPYSLALASLEILSRSSRAHHRASAPDGPACPRQGVTIWWRWARMLALGTWAPSCLLCFPPNCLFTSLGPSQDPRTLPTQVKNQRKLKTSFAWGIWSFFLQTSPGWVYLHLSVWVSSGTWWKPPTSPPLRPPLTSRIFPFLPALRVFELLPGCRGPILFCSHWPHLYIGSRQFLSFSPNITCPEFHFLSILWVLISCSINCNISCCVSLSALGSSTFVRWLLVPCSFMWGPEHTEFQTPREARWGQYFGMGAARGVEWIHLGHPEIHHGNQWLCYVVRLCIDHLLHSRSWGAGLTTKQA